MLVWDQYEFIECLAVLPEIGEDDTYYSFNVLKDGLRLYLTVCQYGGDVYIDLYRDGLEASVFHMRLSECAAARYVRHQNGYECLEFAPAKAFGARYDGEPAMPVGVRVAVNPQIRIELF